MSSIKRIEGGKVADVIESVPYMHAKTLIAEGKAVYASTPVPVAKVQEELRNDKRVIDLKNALEAEQKEKAEMFDELEKAAREKAELQRRLAELEAAQKPTPPINGGKK